MLLGFQMLPDVDSDVSKKYLSKLCLLSNDN